MSTDKMLERLSSDSFKDYEITDDALLTEWDTTPQNILIDTQKKKIEQLDEEIKNIQQDRAQRRILSYALFSFMCAYMLLAMVAVFLCGFCVMYLSDTVLLTLLTTTLADVFGIFRFVAKYLYHSK